MSREVAASGAVGAQRYRTRLLCAKRKEDMTCLAAASDDPAQRGPRTCLIGSGLARLRAAVRGC